MALTHGRPGLPPGLWLAGFWLALLSACGAPAQDATGPTAPTCAGPLVARAERDLEAAAGCAHYAGDITIAGGAIESLTSLSRLERISGTLRIGPTLALVSIANLDRLRAIDGSLVVTTNLSIDGVYLPALESVGGDVHLAGNSAMTGVSAPALARIGGALRIVDHPSLERVDMAGLDVVAEGVEAERNPRLSVMELGDHLGHQGQPGTPDPAPDHSDETAP